jgi:hypothetical protein
MYYYYYCYCYYVAPVLWWCRSQWTSCTKLMSTSRIRGGPKWDQQPPAHHPIAKSLSWLMDSSVQLWPWFTRLMGGHTESSNSTIPYDGGGLQAFANCSNKDIHFLSLRQSHDWIAADWH